MAWDGRKGKENGAKTTGDRASGMGVSDGMGVSLGEEG